MTFLYACVQALHFATLMGVFGASALLVLAPAGGERPHRPLMLGAVTALITAVICLCFAAAEITGDPSPEAILHVVSKVMLTTLYGKIFCVRAMLLTGLCFLCFAERAFGLKAAAAGLALGTWSLTSHAAATGNAYYLHVAIDALHVCTAGFWVGGLMVLTYHVIAAPRDMARLIGLLDSFSRWGAPSVAVLIAAGSANGIFILGTPGMPWSPTYVTLLAIKIVLAGVMVALALTNRFGVLPGLERGDKEAAETIPVTVIVELSCAVVILIIVGFLGIISPMQM